MTRTPDSFAAPLAERLKVSGSPSQYNDLDKFVQEQTLMTRLITESILPCLTLDISDNNVPNGVEKIADWMEQTDKLYLPDEHF